MRQPVAALAVALVASSSIVTAHPAAAAPSAPATSQVSVSAPAAGPEAKTKNFRSIPIVAHRGDSRLAPEETMVAYRQAISAGADVLEGDVQLTKDGRMVLVHDDTLARTTNVAQVFPDRANSYVGDFTLAELMSLDAGSWFSPKFAGEKIATVDELLALVNPKKTALTLELKAPQRSPGVATKLAEALKAKGLDDDSTTNRGAYKIMVHSRDRAALEEFASVLPDVPLVFLTGGPMLDDATLAELSTWTVGVFSDPRRTSATDVARAHKVGLQVWADPVDTPEHMRMALNQGYDWLVTNLPELATRVRAGSKNLFPDNNGVVVDNVFPNPSGDDVQPETGEYVALRNTTSTPVDVSNHYLRENGGRLLRIGAGFVIPPGSLLRVYVGPGTNRADAYYNGYTSGFLNNTVGDTITYFNTDDEVLHSWGYIIP